MQPEKKSVWGKLCATACKFLPRRDEAPVRREGSPWHGLSVVVLKELSDHLTSARMRVLEWLVVLTALAALYGAIQQIKDSTAEDPFLFLRLFTTARDPLPSFVSFLGFLVPLMAIGLGFDAINGEHNRRTLSRIVAQPIYRDALLFGKFLAGLATLSISLLALWLLVIGLGLILLGLPPSVEEMARSLVFFLATICYASVWLALAMLFSILFRSAATAALVTLGLWLFLTVIWTSLAPAAAELLLPANDPATLLANSQMLSRLSPSTLFGEIVLAILSPSIGSVERFLYLSQIRGAVMGAPLPLSASLMIAWPQIVGLIASTILLFVIGYVAFQRQEIRA
jgi:ABC-2 type transport system permease protein